MIITNLRCPTHGSYSGRDTSRGRDTKCPHCDFDGRVRDIDPSAGAALNARTLNQDGAHVLPTAEDRLRIASVLPPFETLQPTKDSIMRVAQSNFLVYLAGPIAGLSYGAATDWRDVVQVALATDGIKALSPMRAKHYLADVRTFTSDGDAYKHLNVLSSNRGIMTRDRYDATRCDALFVNLLGAERVSIGTVMEIAWADAHRIPIVCAIEDKGNPHDHGMISEAIGFRVRSLDEAVSVVKAIADNGSAP